MAEQQSLAPSAATEHAVGSATQHISAPHLSTPADHQAYEDLLAALRKDLQLDLAIDVTPPLQWNAAARVKFVNPAPWITPTLINSWVWNGTTWETAGYLKDPFGFVHLKGAVTGGTTGTAVFVLPVGFRPGAKTLHALPNLQTDGNVQIDTSGNVTLTFAGSPPFGLSGITFLAEN